jgi:hypothetical protein
MNHGKIAFRTSVAILLAGTAACSLASFDGFVGEAQPEEHSLTANDNDAAPSHERDASQADSNVVAEKEAGSDAEAEIRTSLPSSSTAARIARGSRGSNSVTTSTPHRSRRIGFARASTRNRRATMRSRRRTTFSSTYRRRSAAVRSSRR